METGEVTEDGVVASAPIVPARTLADYEQAIGRLLDEMADLVPEDPDSAAKAEVLEMQIGDLISRESAKVDSLGDVLARFKATADALDAESDRLRKRSKRFQNKRTRLVDYILMVMQQSGVVSLEGERHSLVRIQNPDTVQVEDPAALPFPYQRVTVTLRPRNEDEAREMRELLASRVGTYDVEARKPELLSVMKRQEKALGSAMEKGEAAEVESLPGVRLVPGSWRLKT